MKQTQIDINHPIAVVGMQCCYPGAKNYQEYWETIKKAQVFIKKIEDPSTGIPQIYDPDPKAYNKTNSNLGALVDNIEFPYSKFLGLPPVTVNTLNKISRLSLMVAQAAIEDAKLTKNSPTNEKTYVVIANKEYDSPLESYADSGLFYRLKYLKETDGFKQLTSDNQKKLIDSLHTNFFKLDKKQSLDELIHSTAPALAARIAKFNNFSGGITSVDSACASSFSAMDFAVKRLRSKNSDVAVVGGIGRIVPMLYVYCSKALTMSSKGSFPFDERACGFISGEGIGFVVLKRLEDALNCGDHIHGLIRGISPSSDGSQTGPWAPCKNGQKLAVYRSIKQTDYQISDLHYIECHGTGTKVGDLEEVEGVCELLKNFPERKHPIAIGSSKGGIGHLLTGAGMAGFFRTILSIKNKTLPPTAGLQKINPKLPLNENNLFIPNGPTPWELPPHQHTRKAMINCFGFGGTNYNLQLEEYNYDHHKEYFSKTRRTLKNHKSYRQINRKNLGETFNSPIAITGMGFNIPGASNYDELIKNLIEGKNCLTDIDTSRWDHFVGQINDQKKWVSSNKRGGFVPLPDPKDTFRWKIPPTTIKHIDPNQFRLFIAVEEALKQAGLIKKKDILQNTSMLCGVISDSDFMMREVTSLRYNYLKNFIEEKIDFIAKDHKGKMLNEFFNKIKNDLIEYNPDNSVSGVDSMLGSRVAKFFDIKGGSTSINSLCTTGLVGLDHACNSLRTRDLDASVVCASNMAMSGPVFCMHSDLLMMSPDGILRPFDKNRNGIVLGEGVVVFVLRRLEDAIENNENILALIHSTDLANEGLSNQMVTTQKRTAKLCYQRCADSMIDHPPVEYVECHGVGLGVGDQIEMESSLEVYGEKHEANHITIGSIKSSIGHLRVASSLVSLLKAVATLKEKTIFPTIEVTHPDPYLIEHKDQITLATSVTPIKSQTPFVAVSSIGVAGTCGHLIASSYSSSEWNNLNISNQEVNHLYPQMISGDLNNKASQLSEIYSNLINQNDWLKKRLPSQIGKRKKKALDNLLRFTPSEYLEELSAIANKLAIDPNILMETNALSSIVTIHYGECMGFATIHENQLIHGANYDFPFLTKEENDYVPRFLLEYQSHGKIPFIGLFHAGSVLPLAGINSAGLAITYAASSAPEELGEGININVFIRKTLEKCRNLEDFKTLLDENNFEGSWIILVSCKETKKSLMIEVYKDNKKIIDRNKLFHTNHFQFLQGANLTISDDSQIRFDRLETLLKNPINSLHSCQNILMDRFDLGRGKETKFPTKNTLNRYNTGASLYFDHQSLSINISHKNIPTGEGPYYRYTFNPSNIIKIPNHNLHRWIPNTTHLFRPSIVGEKSKHDILIILPNRHQVSNKTYQTLLDEISKLGFEKIELENAKPLQSSYHYVIDLSSFKESLPSPFEYDFSLYIKNIAFYKNLYNHIKIRHKIISVGFKEENLLDFQGEAQRGFYFSLSQDYTHFPVTHITFSSKATWRNIFDILRKCLETKDLPALLDTINNDMYLKQYILAPHKYIPHSNIDYSTDTFLITGGARGITAEIGLLLAKTFKGKYIIIGRSDLPDSPSDTVTLTKNEFLKESMLKHPHLKPKDHINLYEKHQRILETIRNLRKYKDCGVEVYYEKVDLGSDTLSQQIDHLIKKYKKIDHLIHGAGVEFSKKFFDKELDDFKKIYFSKTINTVNLLKPFLNNKPKTITLFSSTSGINGNIGQTDYSSCNTVHFHLPMHLKKIFPNTQIKTIAWPAWAETGMAMNEAVFTQMSKSDVKFIPVKEGTAFFINEFLSKEDSSHCVCTQSHIDATTNYSFYQTPELRKIINSKTNLLNKLAYIDSIIEDTDTQFITQKTFNGNELFLRDHIISDRPTAPGVVLTEMILQNLHLWTNKPITNISIDKISFLSPTHILTKDTPLTITTTLNYTKDQSIKFELATPKYRNDGQMLLKNNINCQGIASISTKHPSPNQLFPHSLENIKHFKQNPNRQKKDFYNLLHDKFPEKLGPSFQNLMEVLEVTNHSLLATAKPNVPKAFGDGVIFFNGAVFDIVNQLMVENTSLTSKEQTFIPGNYFGISFYQPILEELTYFIYLSDINMESDKITFKAIIMDSSLNPVLSINQAEHIKYLKRNA